MKATGLAFYFVCINLAISMVNATDVFSASETVGEDFTGEDWFTQIEDFKDPSKSYIREDANALEEVTGLAIMAINGVNTFVNIVLGALTGMGDLARVMGMPSTVTIAVDTLTILVYIFAIIELKSGRGET